MTRCRWFFLGNSLANIMAKWSTPIHSLLPFITSVWFNNSLWSLSIISIAKNSLSNERFSYHSWWCNGSFTSVSSSQGSNDWYEEKHLSDVSFKFHFQILLIRSQHHMSIFEFIDQWYENSPYSRVSYWIVSISRWSLSCNHLGISR